ncbi:hypothetical protein Tco_0933601 [Tanacetum coccineum]
MKNQVVELERRINHGLRNHQAIIQNLKRQFQYLEKIQPTKSIPRTINTKLRHEFVYKPPSIRNENDMDDVLMNHVGDKELKSYDWAGTGRMKKKEKDNKGMPKEPNKEWKLNEKRLLTTKKFITVYGTQLKSPLELYHQRILNLGKDSS